jgi:hypothetical protein
MNPFQFKISLRFFGSSFDPSDLSAELDMKPIHVQKMGERRKTPKGTELEGTYDASYCTFNIERHGDEDISTTLERFSISLDRHKDLFDRIRSNGGRIELFVGWFSVGNTGGTLPFELLSKLGDLEVDLALDIYGSEPSKRDGGN